MDEDRGVPAEHGIIQDLFDRLDDRSDIHGGPVGFSEGAAGRTDYAH